MKTIKGGIADQNGIRYTPNLDTITQNIMRYITSPLSLFYEPCLAEANPHRFSVKLSPIEEDFD